MIQQLIEQIAYQAHGYCLLWEPWLIYAFAGADALIALSYALIPFALVMVLRRRSDVGYPWLVALFASFILLCGVTHALGVVTLWLPLYELMASMKMLTAVVSLTTAIILLRLVPALVAIPSPAALRESNAKLLDEIAAHRQTLKALREARATLERDVADRTAALSASNKRLELCALETVHRSRNMLGVISALSSQTAKHSADLPDFMKRFSGRLRALSNANTAVVSGDEGAPLHDVMRGQLEHMQRSFPGQISIEGDDVRVSSDAAQQFGLASHELATNAIKHGALRSLGGQVRVRWTREGKGESERLIFEWLESTPEGGERVEQDQEIVPAARADRGFGAFFLSRALPSIIGGEATREVSEDRFAYVLRVPMTRLRPSPVSCGPGCEPVPG